MSATTATVLPIALGAMFVGAGLMVLVYAVVSEIRRMRRRPTPPPLALVASRPEPPTQVIPCITSAAWPVSVDDTVVTFRVLPEEPTQVMPRHGGPRW